MTAANIIWLIVGLMLGAGIGLLAMCLVAAGKLGDDQLPEMPYDRVKQNVSDEARAMLARRGMACSDKDWNIRVYQD